MSNLNLTLLLAAVALVLVAVLLELPIVSGGSGLVYIVALIYAYTVAKREAGLLTYAVRQRDSIPNDQ